MAKRFTSKYTALAWEQILSTAPICAAAMIPPVLISVIAGTLRLGAILFTTDAPDDRLVEFTYTRGNPAEEFFTLSLFVCMLCCVVRQDAAGNLALDFDPRLKRLPVRTLPLVALVFFVRIACLAGVSGATLGIMAVAGGALELQPSLILLVEGYLVFQAIVWSRQSITGIEYAGPLLLTLLFTGAFFMLPSGFDAGDRFVAVAIALMSPVGLLSVLATAFGVIYGGILWQRRDVRFGLPAPGDLIDWGSGAATIKQPFDSPLAAQIWYERQRGAWLMLPIWAIATLALLIGYRAALYDLHYAPHVYRWLPYVGVGVAALIAGTITGGMGSVTAPTRPLATAHLAAAKLLALTPILALTLGMAFVVSTAATVAAANVIETGGEGPGLLSVFFAAWAEREVDSITLLAWLFGPLGIAGFASWILLVPNTIERWSVVVAAVVLAVLVAMLDGFGVIDRYATPNVFDVTDVRHIVVALLAMAMLVLPGVRVWMAHRKNLIPARAVEWSAALTVGIALLMWFYAGKTAFEPGVFLIALVPAGYACCTGASLTLKLTRARHQ